MKYQPGYIRLALPKGRCLSATANLLSETALDLDGYSHKTRQYRLQSARFPYLSAKVFQEKDIPVQVAIGNYELGICGLDWIEELQVRYPASALVTISSLNCGEGSIYLAAAYQAGTPGPDKLLAEPNNWRIVSEYPNLAQALALSLRLKRFRIFPVWGAAEVYPPESADLAILWARNENEIEAHGLVPLMKLLSVDAFLIANRERLENENLSQILDCLSPRLASRPSPNEGWSRDDFLSIQPPTLAQSKAGTLGKPVAAVSQWQEKGIKLALPDGHQKTPTSQFLDQVGIYIEEYSGKTLNRRPSTNLDWLGVKVIRPQDMPLQVANGNFDLAITGKDWLLEHLYRFPLSPVEELVELGFGKVKIVAAVSRDMPAASTSELKLLAQGDRFAPLRVASEYVNIADKYLRDNHISPCKLVPTWGASEAFLPEDADLLIDNAQTGKTLAEHNLEIIDVLLTSTACLIGNRDSLDSCDKRERIEFIVQTLERGLS